MNATAIASSIASTQPRANTHADGGRERGRLLAHPDGSNPKFLLLATDGLPNCMPGVLTPSADDSAGAVQSVQLLADNGIPVYVIGIGMETSAIATLQQLATVGGRPRAADPAYYPVESSADLVDALHAIGAQTMPCTYALPADMMSAKAIADGELRCGLPADPAQYALGVLHHRITLHEVKDRNGLVN
jgi:hypothetical protein